MGRHRGRGCAAAFLTRDGRGCMLTRMVVLWIVLGLVAAAGVLAMVGLMVGVVRDEGRARRGEHKYERESWRD